MRRFAPERVRDNPERGCRRSCVAFYVTQELLEKTYANNMDQVKLTHEQRVAKNKEWMKKHPILTGIIVLLLIGFILSLFGKSSPSQPVATETKTEVAPEQPKASAEAKNEAVVTPPQTQKFEDKIKALAVKTGTTDISFKGIEDQKADSDRPAGSHMFTISLNVTDFYSADSFKRNTGELSAKIFQETFASNPNAYDVIVWYYGETTDQYGNKNNKIILS